MGDFEYNTEKHAKNLIISSGVCQRMWRNVCNECFLQTTFNLNIMSGACTKEIAYHYAVKFLNEGFKIKSIW